MTIGISTKSYAQNRSLQGWKTNTDKKVIALDELKRGGPPKDGIPAIDHPKFISIKVSANWMSKDEPVIAVEYKDEVRAYPLQILIWHEIVNDNIAGEPVLVTFCPLCYSALVFSRVVDGETLEFGVSGFLRHSDMIMYDHKTETLWQQFTGKAIVGDYTGTTLQQIPGQIISFSQFRSSFPDGMVLSRDTGYNRNYGRNPYAGYDNINNTPLFGAGNSDSRLRPMAKVIGVKTGGETKTYPYSISKNQRVINDRVGDTEIVVFHLEGARSALDASQISESKKDGSTGAFNRVLDRKLLTFEWRSGHVYDTQTKSQWNITGKSISGPLKGKQLQPVEAGDYFAFAWLVFWPDTKIYEHE